MGKLYEINMKTITDIIEELKQIDEISLLEILDISSEDILEKFKDLIEERLEYFQQDLEEEE
jgi:hypothetical protein